MAEYTGKDGSCLLNGVALAVTNFSYSGAISVHETTEIGSADKTYKQGVRDGGGSLNLNLDPNDASQKVIIDQLLTGQTPNPVLLQLYADSANNDQLYMSAVIESIELTAVADGLQTWTANYKKTGPLYHVPTT